MKGISNKQLVATAIAFALSGTLSFTATAGVNILTDDITVQTEADPSGYFSQNGSTTERAEPVMGGGDSMSLSLATKVIIPPDWKVEQSGDFYAKTVDWKGGLAWPHIMRNIANDEGIFVSLDWVKKIATINVPEGESLIAESTASAEKLDEIREQYTVKQTQEWQRRVDAETELSNEQDRVARYMENSRAAAENNQEFIANLNKQNAESEKKAMRLAAQLEAERKKNAELAEKYAVIDPALSPSNKQVDAVELYEEYNKRWVLPFNTDFEYFLKGGHSDLLLSETPATYIAKQGSLEDVIKQWASELNWHVEYRTDVRHYNPYKVEFKGNLYEAGRDFISIFLKSRRPLDIKFYPDVKPIVDGQEMEGLIVIDDLKYNRGVK
ncbi:MAG: hypothetical protein CL840_03505 [Crocinitomicaceae bacterium]|nr:hypothetical protein [Crocinitomicaceae bacterium]|tara:strand:- start:1305 stop:2453 length:1149 start_codon:yes stop_codon:yes gene_type:complete